MEERNMEKLKAPFPWFGGKSLASELIWRRLGDVSNYVEPFAGSLAVLLGRTSNPGIETINDLDGFVCNAWRSILYNPDETAEASEWPVSECDLIARHLWLVDHRSDLTSRLCGDPLYCYPELAGWWLWGISSWIGKGWCSGTGPWMSVDGLLVNRKFLHISSDGKGVSKQLPHLSTAGQGVNRGGILAWFRALSDRLRRVRVCCGDWTRVLGPSVTSHSSSGYTGIVLDPPYSDTAGRCSNLYAVDSESVAHDVRRWAIDNGENPKLRIALCGYDTEHIMPDNWERVPWKVNGGYGNAGDGVGKDNSKREVVWFSPACIRREEKQLSFSDKMTFKRNNGDV